MVKILSAFNLNWGSNDINLPSLANNQDCKKINIDIEIKNESPCLWPKIDKSIADTPFLQMSKNDLRLEVDNIGKFRALNGNKISWFKK